MSVEVAPLLRGRELGGCLRVVFLLEVSAHTQKQLDKCLAFIAYSFRDIYCYIARLGNLCVIFF